MIPLLIPPRSKYINIYTLLRTRLLDNGLDVREKKGGGTGVEAYAPLWKLRPMMDQIVDQRRISLGEKGGLISRAKPQTLVLEN